MSEEALNLFNDVRQPCPELKLWASLMETTFWDWLAWQCLGKEWDFRSDFGGSENTGARLVARRTAPAWFKSDDTQAGSFIFCASHLGLEPASIRERLSEFATRIEAMSSDERVNFFCQYRGQVAVAPGKKSRGKRIVVHPVRRGRTLPLPAQEPKTEEKGEDMGRIDKCVKCEEEKEILARGMCKPCYWRDPEVVEQSRQRKAKSAAKKKAAAECGNMGILVDGKWLTEKDDPKLYEAAVAGGATPEPIPQNGKVKKPRRDPVATPPETPKSKEKKPPEGQPCSLVVDFSGCREVLDKITALASDLDRTPEGQARFILRRALRPRKRIAGV